ncbi:trypsin-like peptidase domain-containing protein [Luteolibacter pohnpeiensis]|uniref:Trypsin-like peptidase domain-containing protein n=1 Tax=Luteolibacter pohnpeiensis TaxID=454153 RepID=A0A934S9V9_9BACT|nr:trypsin-like peptidase domain-containing protein [Luteolibacter pohnpeiensis]MBK1884503.1 trypsin-like peptidase domain-containing protein [Luteolibacter pohnpeiensis]
MLRLHQLPLVLSCSILAGSAFADPSPFLVDPSPPPANQESDMLAKVTPAIVSVFPGRLAQTQESEGENPTSPMDRYFRPDEKKDEDKPSIEGVGSGVIVTTDGLIITNHHVVTLATGEAADSLIVELTDRRRFPAKLIGSDRLTDLALLKIDTTGLAYMPFADSAQVRVGDPVFAIGNPFRVGLTVTKGIVSALDRSGLNIGGANTFEGFIQTDAPINPGNSGGALADLEGRLVGINTAIYSQGGGNLGIGFSVPSNLAYAIANRLLRDGKINRGFFGVRSESVDQDIAEKAKLPKIAGALLAEVAEDSPAAKAGWKDGDVITEINGRSISDRGVFRLILSLAEPGEVVQCTGYHDGKAVQHAVTLGAANDEVSGTFEANGLSGVTLKKVEKGLEITEVSAESVAARKFKPGQIIVSLNDEPATGAPALEAAIRRGVNTFKLLADGSEITVILRLE